MTDRLDDNWVNESLRYHLIRSLIETVRDFNSRIRNLKILVAIREDLFERVFELTRRPGYQEEKYKSLCLRLGWKEEELEYLLDLRVDKLVKEQYTKADVKLRALMPNSISNNDPVSYLLDRTLLRPRDAIMFLNECIKVSEGKPRFTQTLIHQAEEAYSNSRLRALADEWNTDYPDLIKLCLLFKKFPAKFKQADILDDFANRMLDLLTSQPQDNDFFRMANDKLLVDGAGLLQDCLMILFRVGLIGMKTETSTSILWSYKGNRPIGGEISTDASLHIHPAFWRVLGTPLPKSR